MSTIPVGSGLASQLVVKDESTWGVAPSFASGIDSFEFDNETLELKKTAVQGEGLAAGHVYPRTKRRVLTNYDANGSISMNLPTRGMNFWLRHMVGDFTETITQMTTTGVYQTIYQPKSGLVGHSFSVQKGVPTVDTATVEPFTYVGCKIISWEVSISTGGIAQLTLSIDARNELGGAGNSDPLNVSVPTLATWALPSSGHGTSVFHFRQAALFSGGTPTLNSGTVSLVGETALGNVTAATIQHAVAFDTNRVFLGGSGFKSEQIENGFRAITGSLQAEFLSSEALYNAFSADTTTSLQLTFTGDQVGTSGTNHNLFDIIIPNIKLDGEAPKVGGPGIVPIQVNFTGSDDEATTPIQITYQSEDSAV